MIAPGLKSHSASSSWENTCVSGAWGTKSTFSEAGIVTAGGVGFRYLVARRLGIYAGLDLAKGPEDTAVYIQAGSAWR